ncbi:unnamed protein product [Linum trigynum]|uniref:Uncharacterized protein n=1 Tax=Linum trigynum TaxID=586398 RepID=A0AAV2CHI5_9ROSI
MKRRHGKGSAAGDVVTEVTCDNHNPSFDQAPLPQHHKILLTLIPEARCTVPTTHLRFPPNFHRHLAPGSLLDFLRISSSRLFPHRLFLRSPGRPKRPFRAPALTPSL